MVDRRSARALAGAAGATLLLVTACSASVSPPRPSASEARSPAELATPAAAAPATPSVPRLTAAPATPEPTLPLTGGEPAETLTETLDPSSFGDPTTIDNAWFPMPPGTQLVLQGKANADDGRVTRKVVFTVTDLTKVIDGVRSVVVYEQDYTAGVLEEAELSFFAQDDDGTVWLMGEYPEEYDEGKFVKAPTWISGLKDAAGRDPDEGRTHDRRAKLCRRLGPGSRLDRPREGLRDGLQDLCPDRLLRRRPGDRRVQPGRTGRTPAEVLRPRRRHRPGRLGRCTRRGAGDTPADQVRPPGPLVPWPRSETRPSPWTGMGTRSAKTCTPTPGRSRGRPRRPVRGATTVRTRPGRRL